MRRWKSSLLAVAVLIPTSVSVLGGSGAGAAPSNAPNALNGTFDCGGGVTGNFVTNSGNSSATTWAVAHLTFAGGGSGIFVPASLNLTFSVDGTPIGPPELATKGNAPAPDTCTIHATVTVPNPSGGTTTATLSGTVTGRIVHTG